MEYGHYRHIKDGTSFEESLESWRCEGSPNIIVIKNPEDKKLREHWKAEGALDDLGQFIRNDDEIVFWRALGHQLFVKMVP